MAWTIWQIAVATHLERLLAYLELELEPLAEDTDFSHLPKIILPAEVW